MIYLDSIKEKVIIKYYSYKEKYYDSLEINYDLINDNNLTSDSFYIKPIPYHLDYKSRITFFFGLEEKYYLFNKKYFGNIDFYKYNHELNSLSEISPFLIPFELYNNIGNYEIINNKLLIISGYQLLSSCNSHESLYYSYFQKVNDLEYIRLNSKMFLFNNLVKLLNENKTYYLDFNVDHLIKLDDTFLEAEITFIDKNGTIYKLNKDNKIIKDLKGEGIIVKSAKLALIYFYKRINNISELGIIEFDKSQKGKNMKFNITSNYKINIKVAKDFGFKGYYPMLSEESMFKINSENYEATIYVENLYDKLNYELYDE